MTRISPGPAAGAQWAGSWDATFPGYLPTVAGLLADARRRHPRNLAVATPGSRLTYEELDKRSALLSALLVARVVGKGAVVRTFFPNVAEGLVSWAAITAIIRVAAPVTPLPPPPQMALPPPHPP